MSVPPVQPATQPFPPPAGRPVVQLPTWVNVVLVLILLVSCGAASDNGSSDVVSSSSVANQVVNELQSQSGWGTPAGPASTAEVEDLCRLLGAVAAKEGVPLTVMSQDELTRCHEVAQEAASAAKP